MGAIIAMKPFQNTFDTGLTGEKIAIITSLYSVYVLSFRANRPFRSHNEQRSAD